MTRLLNHLEYALLTGALAFLTLATYWNAG